MDSFEKINETKLPSLGNDWRNSFTGYIDVSEADILRATNVWNAFEWKNIRDYCDIYLKTDVLLLADVFEIFRSLFMSVYYLDPTHYYSAPNISWDAMLKTTAVKIQLILYRSTFIFREGY